MLANNRLSGPAFPSAWQQGSMPELRHLMLTNNSQLTGTLPPSLDWPQLVTL